MCRRCNSNQTTCLGAEVNIHFAGLVGLDRPAVLVFPQLVVCLQCGFVEFDLDQEDIPLLATANPLNNEAA
jgi:hypothetical protein